MTGAEFRSKAKKLGARTKKVDSAYWGKVWYEAIFENKVAWIEIHFEENIKVEYVTVLGKNDCFATAEDLAQSAVLQTKIALFVHEINQ